jgi:hypothetical protein
MQQTATPQPASARVPPRWIRAIDAVAAVACLLACLVFVLGGFAAHLGPLKVSVRSPLRLLFVAAAAVAIRHAAYPAEPLHRRIVGGLRSLREDSPVWIAGGALTSRAAVLIVGYFAVLTVGFPGARPSFEVSSDPLFNLPARFDAGWYGGIALDGYSFQGRFDRQQNVAFFPAMPLLMRAAGQVAGAFEAGAPPPMQMARVLWAGTLLALAAFVWASWYLVRLARDTIGDARATDAVWLLASYPFAVFFSAPYTESLFLLGAVAAFYHSRRREWRAAIVWGLIVGLTRPNGCLLSIPLAVLIAIDVRRSVSSRVSDYPIVPGLAAAAAPGIGMLLYSAYVHQITGSWFGWARLHEAWGRSFEGLAPIARAFGWIEREGLLRVVANVPYDTLNALGLIFALALLWPVFRRLGTAWGLFVVVNVLPPLLAGGVLSMGRLSSTLFPSFLALAVVLPRRTVLPVVLAFALGQALVAILFFTWRPLF